MSAHGRGGDDRGPRARLRQAIAGIVAVPLSVLPFVGYTTLTPEGRLVRDRAWVAVSPPSLPKLSQAQKEAVTRRAPRYEGGVMALAYHGIGSGSDAEGGFVLSSKRFGEHLAVLRAAGMHTVTAADVAAAFNEGRPLPPNAVMISFDDGRTDAMMFADPLLAEARMQATMFVIVEAASQPGVYYAPWERIEAYARSGRWDIQSHTASSHHEQEVAGGGKLPALTSLAPGESLDAYRARVRADLAEASSAIEAHTRRRPVAFAYPFGAYGADRTNDPAIRDVLRQEVSRQYSLAFHQDEQESVPLAASDQDRLGLRRLEVENWSGLELLDRISRPVPGAPSPSIGGDVAPAPPVAPPPPPDATGVPAPAPSLAGRPPLGRPAPYLTSRTAPASAPYSPVPPNSTPATTPPAATSPPTTSPPTSPQCVTPGQGKGPKSCPPGRR